MILKNEKLSYSEVFHHFEEASVDFPYSREFLQEYSHKLSDNANFITMRDADEHIVGLIGYYNNILPNAYITHVWVQDNARGYLR